MAYLVDVRDGLFHNVTVYNGLSCLLYVPGEGRSALTIGNVIGAIQAVNFIILSLTLYQSHNTVDSKHRLGLCVSVSTRNIRSKSIETNASTALQAFVLIF